MADTFGDVLRSLRTAAGLSLVALARRTSYSASLLQLTESGHRRPTVELAQACDRALDTAPLLSTILELSEQGDDMLRRRALFAMVAAGAGGAAAELIRHGLLDAAAADEDWDAVVASYTRRLATDPSEAYGQSLLAQLTIARQQIIDGGTSPERLRVVAQLGQLYGLWLGNRGDVASARNWYRTATVVADRSGDASTRAYVRGRAASRGIYEGYTVGETVADAREALAITAKPCAGALEAWSALVHVHGLTGNLSDGRRAVAGMREVADALPDRDGVAGPAQRAVSFANYLEGRTGPLGKAETAYAEADRMLRSVPVWWADATLYYSMAQVRHGDPEAGVARALGAMKGLGSEVRVLSLGVRDLVGAVPKGYASGDLDELRTYASTSPGPWETLAL